MINYWDRTQCSRIFCMHPHDFVISKMTSSIRPHNSTSSISIDRACIYCAPSHFSVRGHTANMWKYFLSSRGLSVLSCPIPTQSSYPSIVAFVLARSRVRDCSWPIKNSTALIRTHCLERGVPGLRNSKDNSASCGSQCTHSASNGPSPNEYDTCYNYPTVW